MSNQRHHHTRKPPNHFFVHLPSGLYCGSMCDDDDDDDGGGEQQFCTCQHGVIIKMFTRPCHFGLLVPCSSTCSYPATSSSSSSAGCWVAKLGISHGNPGQGQCRQARDLLNDWTELVCSAKNQFELVYPLMQEVVGIRKGFK